MYTSKLKIKTSSVNAWTSLCWWPDLSDCVITSSIPQGRQNFIPTQTRVESVSCSFLFGSCNWSS